VKERINCILHFSIQLNIGVLMMRTGRGQEPESIKHFHTLGILSLYGFFQNLLEGLVKHQKSEVFKYHTEKSCTVP